MPKLERITPLLVCEDISAEHDFLVEVFGFKSANLYRDPEGKVIHGEVRAGDTAVYLHRVAPEHALSSPRSMPNASCGLVVYVDDVDAHFAHARSHGAKIDKEPQDMPYGQREYGARDPEGHRWWFATPLKQVRDA